MSETLGAPGNVIEKENGEDNESDLFTKELGAWKHYKFCDCLGLRARL